MRGISPLRLNVRLPNTIITAFHDPQQEAQQKHQRHVEVDNAGGLADQSRPKSGRMASVPNW